MDKSHYIVILLKSLKGQNHVDQTIEPKTC